MRCQNPQPTRPSGVVAVVEGMFSACLPRREPLTADNYPSGPSAPESSRPAGAFDAPHACDASSSSLDDDGPHDRVCVIVNVRAPGAKTAVKRLKRLHDVEVLVMDSKSQERLLRRLEELLVGSLGNDARDEDDGHGRGGRIARRIRFLAGGGDGTIAATASLIALACERAGLAPELRAPVAPLPLGTGNELSRICGWGALYAGAPLERIVRDVSRAYLAKLDTWTATMTPNETQPFGGGFDDVYDGRRDESGRKTQVRKFCCFFSVGFDAAISHRFTRRRERDPKSCATAWRNKAWYAYYGAAEFVNGGGHLLGEDGKPSVELWVDGERIRVARDLNSVQVFNIHSSADGVDFWGTNRASVKGELADDAFAPPCVGDGMLEVVGTRGVSDLVAARSGFSHSRRLAQGRRVELRTSSSVAAQMDGETWVLPPSSVVITHAGSIPLCVGPGATRNLRPGLETSGGGGGGCLRL